MSIIFLLKVDKGQPGEFILFKKQIRLGLLTFSYDTTDCVKPNYGFHPGIFSVAQKQLSHQFIAETFLKFHIPIL